MMTLENILSVLHPYAEVRVFNSDETECYADCLVRDIFEGAGIIWSKGFYQFGVLEVASLGARQFKNKGFNGEIFCIYLDVDTLPHYAD